MSVAALCLSNLSARRAAWVAKFCTPVREATHDPWQPMATPEPALLGEILEAFAEWRDGKQRRGRTEGRGCNGRGQEGVRGRGHEAPKHLHPATPYSAFDGVTLDVGPDNCCSVCRVAVPSAASETFRRKSGGGGGGAGLSIWGDAAQHKSAHSTLASRCSMPRLSCEAC